jgi:hypothetical protein
LIFPQATHNARPQVHLSSWLPPLTEEQEGEERGRKKLLANSQALLIFIISSEAKFMLYILTLSLSLCHPQTHPIACYSFFSFFVLRKELDDGKNHLFALTVLPLIPNLVYLFILFFLHFRLRRSVFLTLASA